MSKEMMSPYDLLVDIRENKILYQYFAIGAVILRDDESWLISGESDAGEAKVVELCTGVLRISLPLYVDPELPLPALEKVILSMQQDMEGILMIEFVEGLPQGQYSIHTTLEGLDDGLRKFLEESREFKTTVSNILKNIEEIKKNMAENIQEKMEAAGLMKVGGGRMPPKMKDLEENTSVWNAMEEVDKSPEPEERTRSEFPPLEPEDEDLELYLDDEIDMNPPRPFEDNTDDSPWFEDDESE